MSRALAPVNTLEAQPKTSAAAPHELLVAHRDGLRAQRVVRRDADRLERRRVIIKFLAAEGEVLLLGLDNLGIWPVWKSRSD